MLDKMVVMLAFLVLRFRLKWDQYLELMQAFVLFCFFLGGGGYAKYDM